MLAAAQQFNRDELFNDIILLSGRFHGLEKDRKRMMVEENYYGVQMARLRNVALDYNREMNIPKDYDWNGKEWVEGPLEETEADTSYSEESNLSNGGYTGNQPSREVKNPVKRPAAASKGAKTILYLAASPKGESRIQGDVEFREMDEALRKGREREGYELLRPEFAITGQGLIDALSQEPNVVHFSAHGEDEHLIFTDEKNEPVEIPFVALMSQFEQLKGITELVVFNSCYSADMAKELSKLGMYVSGNNLEILDEASINFVKGLYTGLGNGKSYERAFNDALTLVTIMNPDEVHIMEIWKDGEKLDI